MGKYTTDDIMRIVREEDIKFIRLQFVDFFGGLKNIAITAGQLPKAFAGKCCIDGFHIRGMEALGRNVIHLEPDLDTFAILPWRPSHGRVARFLCRLTDENGHQLRESSRYILRSIMKRAADLDYTFDLNPRCEFFLFLNDENGSPTTHTGECAGYLDVAPMDRGENARRDVILTLEEMGFEIESSYHENSPGQHAVEFRHAEGIRVADQIVTFRTTVRMVAERHGMHATFMPKPRTDLMGSAMSLRITASKGGKDLFTAAVPDESTQEAAAGGMQGENACVKTPEGHDPCGKAPDWYSAEAAHFTAGLLAHQRGIAAFSNPVINSYKRLKAYFHAPTELFWSASDYYAPVRLLRDESGKVQIEWKLPDGAANPYLTIAMAVAAGMDGIEHARALPEDGLRTGILPATLRESVQAFEEDTFLRSVCTDAYARMYIQEKMKEWERYSREVTDWEINEYLRTI
ncbi:MAG: glutamine synthetase [Eubacterium sp.]|nr:glutamine synthetase [Eubacterium sp.]